MKIKNYRYIDSLRGLAILGVIATHCQLYGTNFYSPAFKSLLDHGSLGVQLFFVISALTLSFSYNQRSVVENHPVLNFYIRRFFRIAPLFYLAIIFYTLCFYPQDRLLLKMPLYLDFGTIFSPLTFTHGLNPYWINALVPGGWSIAVEMGFYLLFPLLFSKIKNLRTSLRLSFFSAILFQVFQYLFVGHPLFWPSKLWQDFLYYFFPSQLSVFLVGFCLYHLVKKPNPSFKPLPSDLILGQLFILLLVIQLASQTIFPYHFIFSVLFGIGIYFLSIHPTKLFVNPITSFIGKISFGLYLSHFAVLKYLSDLKFVDFVNNPPLNFTIRYALVLLVAVAISSITYRLVELPGISLGKKIIQKVENSIS